MGIRWGEAEGSTSYIHTYTDCTRGLDILSFFRDKTSSSVELLYILYINVFDQGTVLLQGVEYEKEENISFCAPVESPGATEPTPWFPGIGGFLLLFQFHLQFAVYSRTARRGIGPGIEERWVR